HLHAFPTRRSSDLNVLVEDQTAGYCFYQFGFELAILITYPHPTLDPSMLRDPTFIQGYNYILLTIENHSFARNNLLWSGPFAFGHIIKSQYHVLRRYRNRRPISRVKDIVRGKHQSRSF